jgi:hypothetical protein
MAIRSYCRFYRSSQLQHKRSLKRRFHGGFASVARSASLALEESFSFSWWLATSRQPRQRACAIERASVEHINCFHYVVASSSACASFQSLSVALKNRNISYSSKVQATPPPRRFLKAVLPLVERLPSQATHACRDGQNGSIR